MFKNMKLATKIGGGFAIVLILTAIVGYVGFNGLGSVTTIVDKADDGNRLIKFAKDCRVQEKNFIMRGDKKYQKENDETMAKIYEQIDATMAKLNDPSDKTLLGNVEKAAKAYKTNFDGWIELWDQQKVQEKAMVDNARAFIVECDDLSSDQEEKLNEDMANAELSQEKKQDRLWKADSANQLIKFAKDCRIQEKNFIMHGDKKYQKDNDETISKINALCDELYSKFNQQINKDQVTKVKNSAEKYKAGFDGWIALWDKQQQAAENMVTNARDFTQLCEEFRTGQKTKMEATTARSNTIMIIGAIVAIITGSILAFFITRGIVKPFQNIFKGLKTFSAHELEETGQTFKRIIEGITNGSEEVASASGQVSAASQSLAEGATEQAAGLEETSSSLEEMASMTKQNADNAQQANTLASDARKAADTGNESMGKMNTAIQDIQKSSDETAKIIKVIDEIAFQTNLLALNAAVEAARAGEAGKGFAVVAEEVRNLAMRSAEAAKDTSAMIEESVKNANNGVEIATEVSKVLEEIVEGVAKTTDLVGEIAAASQEQSQGIDQVNTAVNQMDKVTQQNAANAEESASASEELSAQAEQMSQIVNELIVLVGGTTSAIHTKTGKSSGNSTVNRQDELSNSDQVFHEIAGKTETQSKVAANSIPLENDSCFNEFNS